VRTWWDIARLGTFGDTLSAGDSGLRLGLFKKRDLGLYLTGTAKGVERMRRAAGFLDARRESPLESLSMSKFIDWAIPLPEPQHEILDTKGEVLARVDFWWECGVVGEADGRLKYARESTLYAEKRREDALRELGLEVIRWSWSDVLGQPDRLRRRILLALDRARR
jgi:hypothetical protein